MSAVASGVRRIRTASIEVATRQRGAIGNTPVFFLHGNLSSSTFWEATIAAFAGEFHCIAPDLRGFGATEALPIRASTGIDDMADDVFALSEVLGIERFHIVGHSMGGGVAMKMLLKRPGAVFSVSLVNPISPYGYGGSRDEWGTPCFPDGAPAGAGTVDPDLLARLRAGDRTAESPASPRNVMTAYYFKPPFVPPDVERLLDGMLTTLVGDDWYPGDAVPSNNWPGTAPGSRGVVNAIAGHYFDASAIVNLETKPPVLWVRGAQDAIISDRGALEVSNQGVLGSIPGWPGMSACPPQPMVRQTRAVLGEYCGRGGLVAERVVADCGHTPFIEKPLEFNRLLLEFLRANP